MAGFEDGEIWYISYDAKLTKIETFKNAEKLPVKIIVEDDPNQMDVSTNGDILRVNTLVEAQENKVPPVPPQICLKYFKLDANPPSEIVGDSLKSMRDKQWLTETCIVQGSSRGVWPSISEGDDVNCLTVARKAKVIATGDDYSMVKLFRYPSEGFEAGYLSYLGHAANVTNVKFSYDEKYLISVGGDEKTIF